MDARVRAWLDRDPDPETRAELEGLLAAGNTPELERRFRARLEFGTAGLRGILGAGPNRMNSLVVRESTAGLGAYLLHEVKEAKQRGVVIGFDGRRKSRQFADDAAATLAALKIRVHLCERETPTPVCAFAVQALGAAAGIVITASHNPPEYNGYKVYWQDGAQIVPPHDHAIAAAIDEASRTPLPWCELAQARRAGLVASLGDELTERYLKGVAGLSIHKTQPGGDKLAIAYTPLHGVGARTAEAALRRAGFSSVHTVAEQREPDAAFPTVRFPNPEEPGAMDRVLALARQHGAALACANDPDADRLAVAVRDRDGEYRQLTGDQVGALLGADVMRNAPAHSVVATTIVSSRLLGEMAAADGVGYFETLTGFKWIAHGALAREASGENFLFGYEEALGYTLGTLVRDKDGISALVAFAELAADCATRGENVLEALEAIYRRHGLYLTAQKSLPLDPERHGPGIGEKLRARPPDRVAGRDLEAASDLLTSTRRERTGGATRLDLPQSDVLIYALSGGARVIVRPSGTEPKLKCYYEVRETVAAAEPLTAAHGRAQKQLDDLMSAHQREIAALQT